MSFCDRLATLSTMSSRPVHAIARLTISFLVSHLRPVLCTPARADGPHLHTGPLLILHVSAGKAPAQGDPPSRTLPDSAPSPRRRCSGSSTRDTARIPEDSVSPAPTLSASPASEAGHPRPGHLLWPLHFPLCSLCPAPVPRVQHVPFTHKSGHGGCL